MNPDKPQINFLFPYRWLNEDRKFLGENLKRQIIKFIGGTANLDQLENILAYRVMVYYVSNKPVNAELTKTEVQKYLKECFPNAKCLSVDIEFGQHRSKTMLPLFDFRVYF